MLDLAIAREEEFLALLETLVGMESPTHDKRACDALALRLAELLEEDGWKVTRHPREAAGDILEARLAGSGDGPSTLLLTHYDTVWPLGSLERMPWRREGDRVYGPGTCDMKAGIAAAMVAVRLAREAGGRHGDVTLLATSDEETGSRHSRALIEELAPGHDRVLVLETGRDDGAVKIGRKGVGDYRVLFRGRSAHAGNHPDRGASALRELAHFLLFAESLGDTEAGTTVNVTVASGGTTTNVIAEEALARIDMRVLRAGEDERVDAALRSYRPRDSRVTVEVEGGLNRPPLEPTEANGRLWAEARERLAELGIELEGAIVGGGSDGNFTSALGVPTLDGLGSVGAGAHARDEHIRVRETLERVALVAALLDRGSTTP